MTPFAADAMKRSAREADVVRGTKGSRVCFWVVVSSLFVSGVILKLEPLGPSLMNVGVMALCVFTIGACYSTYLGIGSFVSGQSPAPHAKVPVDCKVVRGFKATVCNLSMTLAGICMAIFTTMIAWVPFVR